jgi:putative transposase
MRRLKQLEEENGKLKRIVADLALDKEMLQDVIKRNVWSAPPVQVRSRSNDDSLLKCIRPLASELRLQPGHDEIRTPRSQITNRALARFH